MQHLKCDNGKEFKCRDVVYTPAHIAKEIIDRYQPTGIVLDPCAGDGAFCSLVSNCLWCELETGVDFFEWTQPVDWIIGNPPYSIINQWLEHSFSLADNIVYLLPIVKVFGSRKRLLMIKEYGGIVEIYAPWTGRAIGFEFGWACGCIHFKRNYKDSTRIVV